MKLLFKRSLIIFLAIILVISFYKVNAQVSEQGIPESFQLQQKHAILIPSLILDSVRVQKMLENDAEFKIDNRYGVVQSCNINIKASGAKIEIQGKGTIWQHQIESNDGFSLGIFFKTFHLPKGASVFIYDTKHLVVRGAFTQKNNNSENELPVAEFPGKNLIIEYFEPFYAEFSGELVLGSVSQAYLDFKSIAASQIGINCPEGDNWKVEKKCVCLMTFQDSKSSYYCSGALINNTKLDETPYFLTANHCISSEQVAKSLVTYFNNENSTCYSNDASFGQSLAGATLLAGSDYTDFSLLLLNEYPPVEYNPFYAGWDASGDIPTSGVCIHHPQGDPKCISIDNNPATNYAYSVKWADSDGRTISTTLANTHWQVKFDKGNTEEGSSGSPLFDQNKRIVGQLHGGSNASSLYGKLSLSWNHDASFDKQLAHWLDPNQSVKRLDGMIKLQPKTRFYAQTQQVCVNNAVQFTDESMHKPLSWLWKISPSTYQYTNGTDSLSQNPQILFLKDGNYTVSLLTRNQIGSDELVLQNYIEARSKLDVRFLKAQRDSVVCGCDLKSFKLLATGAYLYDIKVDKPELIQTKVSADTMFLTLDQSASNLKSFDTWVKVNGTFGKCSASDSLLLHVVIQPNDNIANAQRLSLGRNTGFSNQCATVEFKEPFPNSSGCETANSWCPDFTKSTSVVNNSIWFTFTAPSSGSITINTAGFDDQIAVYQASSASSLLSGKPSQYTRIAANDNRSGSDKTAGIENLALEPNSNYWLQVDGNNGAFGNLIIDMVSNSLEVFPNPSNAIFTLLIANHDAGMAEIIVSNLNGRKLMTKQENVSIDSNRFRLDLSGLPKGIYLLNVKINGSNMSKKLVRM